MTTSTPLFRHISKAWRPCIARRPRTARHIHWTIPALLAPVTALALFATARPAAAWEDKGHRIINQLAAESLPAGTPAFFREATARLAYLGPEPDRWKSDSGAQLYAVNGPDHFMDFEPVANLVLPSDRYKYIALVDQKGLRQKGFPAEKIGFLPYRIAELTQTLQSEWRDWRTAKDGTPEKAQIEQDIIYTAGILGHFVADASNPHHTTVHFNGWDDAYAPNPNGYTTAKAEQALRPNGFHHRFEGAFVDAWIDAGDVRPLMTPTKPVGDIFDTAVAYIKASNALVPTLYDLEKENAFHTNDKASARGVLFARERLASGASMLRDIWVTAIKGPTPRRSRTRTEPSSNGSGAPAPGATEGAAPAVKAGS